MQEPTARGITYVPLEALRPAERNPKEHDVANIVALIRRYGFTSPMIVDDRTERLHAGHGRVVALITMRAAGDPTPDGILTDEDGGWLVPIVRGWRSRNDVEAEAALISNNKAQDQGGWDYRELADMVEDITAYDGEMFHELQLSTEDMEQMFRFTPDTADGQQPERPDTDTDSDSDDRDPTPDIELDTTGTDTDGEATTLHVECPACHHTFTLGGE